MISLLTAFFAKAIEIDKLLYLALMDRPQLIWLRESDEVVEDRKRIYLSEAFLKFSDKTEKENIETFQEYDEKYSIHYQCGEWMDELRMLLEESGDKALFETVSGVCEKMEGNSFSA